MVALQMKSAVSTLAIFLGGILCLQPFHAQTSSGTEVAIVDTKSAELPRLREAWEFLNAWPGVNGIVWSSDGTKVAAYAKWSNLITVWNANGTVFRQIHRGGDHFVGNALAFVANDTQIASRPEKTGPADVVVSIFDLRTGAVVQELPSQHPGQEPAFQRARALASSPDGLLLAVAFGGGVAEPVALYKTEGWRKLSDIPSRDQLRNVVDEASALAFSRDGHYLAIGTTKEVLIYDVRARQIIHRIAPLSPEEEMGCCVDEVSFNPDATAIAVATSLTPGQVNGPGGMRKVVPRRPSGSSGWLTGRRSHPTRIRSGRLTRWNGVLDGRIIAFIIRDELHIWKPSNPGDRKTVNIRRGGISLAFAPNSQSLAVGNGLYLTVFDILK